MTTANYQYAMYENTQIVCIPDLCYRCINLLILRSMRYVSLFLICIKKYI